MQTVHIEPARWSRTFEEFSASHEGSLVSVDILAPELGAQPEMHDLPLDGVVAEPGRDGGVITIAASKPGATPIAMRRWDDVAAEVLAVARTR